MIDCSVCERKLEGADILNDESGTIPSDGIPKVCREGLNKGMTRVHGITLFKQTVCGVRELSYVGPVRQQRDRERMGALVWSFESWRAHCCLAALHDEGKMCSLVKDDGPK